jgi:hypothetical protein
MLSAVRDSRASVSVAEPTAVADTPSESAAAAIVRIPSARSVIVASFSTGTITRIDRYSPSSRSITRLARSGAAAYSASYTAATFRSGTPSSSVSAAASVSANESSSAATVAITVNGDITGTASPRP